MASFFPSRDVAKDDIYHNILVQGADGKPLSRCPAKRANWYIKQGLVDIIQKEPLIIRLKWNPEIQEAIIHPYDIALKKNRCVVCDEINALTRHHIIPFCFRRYMPLAIKDYSSYDIMPLCVKCHDEYECYASKYKNELIAKHSLVKNGKMPENELDLYRAKHAVSVLLQHREKIPADKVAKLEDTILKIFPHKTSRRIDVSMLEHLFTFSIKKKEQHWAKLVVENEPDLDKFFISWRKHFVDHMKPKFLPPLWDINREICKERIETAR